MSPNWWPRASLVSAKWSRSTSDSVASSRAGPASVASRISTRRVRLGSFELVVEGGVVQVRHQGDVVEADRDIAAEHFQQALVDLERRAADQGRRRSRAKPCRRSRG
jgi:hypothetical protein